MNTQALTYFTCGLLGAGSVTAAPAASHARAAWLSESTSCEAGQPLQTAVRLEVDAGWHVYWCNPGEGGMPTTIDWRLPPGWTAGPLGQPLPRRFVTSGLHGFGHEGTVLLPVTLTAPADFTGRAKLEATLSWLTCHDDACVPGEARLELEVAAGAPSPTRDAPAILKALAAVPEISDSLVLAVAERQDKLELTIRHKDGQHPGDPPAEAFPVTPNVVEPAKPVSFAVSGSTWRAEVPKSAYASGPVTTLALAFSRPGQRPVEVVWHQAP
jgi:thiol:disulfide interchange protein DsbD